MRSARSSCRSPSTPACPRPSTASAWPAKCSTNPPTARGVTVEVGFVGLGNMGFPMARRLIEAGRQVVAFDTRTEAVDRLVALGGQAAASAKEVADRAETVLASLPTPQVSLE